jgi:CDP-diacylglycerol--glycerol-3-phosphate 3-phosphatidyltransferase
MLSLSNGLSFLRAPLALLFLTDNLFLRILAIVLAMITDSIDGYFARRYRSASQFGAILDPAMDKFFVFFGLGVLIFEHRLEVWQACAMISRDFFLIAFGIYLSISRQWNAYECKSIRWGKVTTALQFFVLIGLTVGIVFPPYTYLIFILSGTLAFIELCLIKKRAKAVKEENS